MNDRENPLIDLATTFALGALFGAGMALFLTPQSGEELREDLGRRGRRWSKEAGRHLGDAEEQMGDVTARIAEAVEDGVQSIRETVEAEVRSIEKKFERKKKKGLFG